MPSAGVFLSGLTTLDLHDNCVERMPLELGQLSRLKKLNLSHNRYRTNHGPNIFKDTEP
jgi:Leucine-rich repeat (LRR) protein